MPAERSQLCSRVFQPVVAAGSTVSGETLFPKKGFPGPQVSMLPVVVGLWAAGFSKLQLTTKSPLLSVHERVCEETKCPSPAGLKLIHSSTVFVVVTYSPRKNFT